jgi:tetratricopeptide (TPR) repeat protein
MSVGSLDDLGTVAWLQGYSEQAQTYYEEGLTLRRELGDSWGVGWSLNHLGEVAWAQGDYQRAHMLVREGQTQFQELGYTTGSAWSLHLLGRIARDQYNAKQAAELFAESLTLYRELDHKEGIAWGLVALGGLAARQGQPARTGQLFGAAEALCEAISISLDPTDRAAYERSMAAAREQIGEMEFTVAWAQGRAMPLEQVIAHALESSDVDPRSSTATPAPQ